MNWQTIASFACGALVMLVVGSILIYVWLIKAFRFWGS